VRRPRAEKIETIRDFLCRVFLAFLCMRSPKTPQSQKNWGGARKAPKKLFVPTSRATSFFSTFLRLQYFFLFAALLVVGAWCLVLGAWHWCAARTYNAHENLPVAPCLLGAPIGMTERVRSGKGVPQQLDCETRN
jgi:hypothetical protein